MIKCPSCGSTAQVKHIGAEWGSETAIRKFACGCGCEFLRFYNVNDLCEIIKAPNTEKNTILKGNNI